MSLSVKYLAMRTKKEVENLNVVSDKIDDEGLKEAYI